MLIRLAISRSREFSADESGAQIAGGPQGLINALKKLEIANHQIPMNVNPATSHMFIVMPLTADGAKSLFRTHPTTESRIARLLPLLQNQPQNPYAATV
jgi:heat shock protein HtpX